MECPVNDEITKEGQKDYLYINMPEMKWATSFNMAMAIEESEWKREIEEASIYSRCGINFILVTLRLIGYLIAGDRAFVHRQKKTCMGQKSNGQSALL